SKHRELASSAMSSHRPSLVSSLATKFAAFCYSSSHLCRRVVTPWVQTCPIWRGLSSSLLASRRRASPRWPTAGAAVRPVKARPRGRVSSHGRVGQCRHVTDASPEAWAQLRLRYRLASMTADACRGQIHGGGAGCRRRACPRGAGGADRVASPLSRRAGTESGNGGQAEGGAPEDGLR